MLDMSILKAKRAYADAKQRCYNPKHRRYVDWGGRGIQVKFSSVQELIDDIGLPMLGESLDRKDNDGHYEKGNVRWVSRSTQQHNKRVSKHNKHGVTGVRVVKAKGLVTITYQATINVNSKFLQLYCGPDFFEACCARKSYEKQTKE